MARNVFSNDMVAHVWAQRNQDSGRSNNGQLYFTGPRIYSYGSHFLAGVFDELGRAWINANRYSRTTGKHLSYIWRAVRHRTAWEIPDLTAIGEVIQEIGKPLPAWAKARLSRYLDSHWEAFPADSDKGQALWSAIHPRASWEVEHARRTAKAASAAKKAARLNRKADLARAKEVAAIPLDMVRLRMIQTATNASDWNRERDLKAQVSYYLDAHRGSAPGKVRAACWQRVKLARELAARLNRNGKGRNDKARYAIATLRRIWAGDYAGATTPLSYAMAARENVRTLLGRSLPSPLRAKGLTYLESLNADIERLERERERERMAAQEADRLAWLAGEGPRNAYALEDERGGALIRARDIERDGCRIIGGTLETSQGATVPLTHAVRAFAFVRAVRARGEEWTRNGSGLRVGYFQIDRVNASGDFEAGCHTINWGEVERLARALDLWDCDDSALAIGEEV